MLRQSDGNTFWVSLSDLANNASCINCHHLPDTFPHLNSLCHLSPCALPKQPMIFVESPEPTDLLIHLQTAPQHDMDHSPMQPPQLLLISGVAGAGKSSLITALRASMPEQLMFPTVMCTGALSWIGTHNTQIIISSESFAELQNSGSFVYSASLSPESCVQWGVLKADVQYAPPGFPATQRTDKLTDCKPYYAVIEEHPFGVMAARSAGVACQVLHVSVQTVDVMDQRLRMSEKCYEEHQVCLL